VLVTDTRRTGLFLDTGALATVTDLTIERVESQVADGRFGHGLNVQRTARIEGASVRVDGTRGFGVLVSNAYASLSQLSVLRPAPYACGTTTCSGAAFGVGVAGHRAAELNLAALHVEDAALCGLYVDDDVALAVDGGALVRNEVGVCVASPSFDVDRLSSLTLADNGRNLDSVALPIPDLPDSIALAP
jgi:hypothetical protein